MKHSIDSTDSIGAGLIAVGGLHEEAIAPGFLFNAVAIGPREEFRSEYVSLRDRIAAALLPNSEIIVLQAELDQIPTEVKWRDEFHNQVKTVGKNNLLDVYFRNQSQTATWYVGLVSSVSYTDITNAADTMGSHTGWTEAGAANAPTYSQGTRPALTVATPASAGSLSSSAASVFSITGTGTAKGAFITSINVKDGTTGTLYSAGLFTGGDRAVINGDTINVSTTLSA